MEPLLTDRGRRYRWPFGSGQPLPTMSPEDFPDGRIGLDDGRSVKEVDGSGSAEGVKVRT